MILGKVNGSADLTADLAQSTFEVVLNKRDDVVENLGAYIRGIALRLVIAHFRRKGNAEADPGVSQLVESAIGAVSVLQQRQDADLLTRALRSLPVEDQQYLLWIHVDGLSQLEIAERVGLTRSQVNGRIDRARAKLRRRVEELAESAAQRSSVAVEFDAWVSSLRRREAEAPLE